MDHILNSSIELLGRVIPNRVVFQPMEGCDCNTDGTPSDLTVAKYHSAAPCRVSAKRGKIINRSILKNTEWRNFYEEKHH